MKVIEQILFQSIEEVGNLYRKKEVSPVEVTEATLNRLYSLEPKLNAFITVLHDEAIEEAKRAEAVFLRGEQAGRLTGIPISIKDIFMTKGTRTSLASRILANHVPDHNSHVYTALRNAGAVVFGKNNMLEFAYGSVHSDYGQCNNPWDTKRTSGGSSTGSAASVGAGIGFASIGTDTGGSIRIPAAFCGVVGMKPSYETVNSYGLFPLSDSLDHIGPLTRTVRDNAYVLQEIATRPCDFTHTFTGDIHGVNIGVIREFIDDTLHPEVRSLFESAVVQLQELGADITEVDIPGILTAEEAGMPIILAEASYHHREWVPGRAEDYAPGTYGNLREGLKIDAVSYLQALEARRQFTNVVNEAFEKVDILICPTAPYPATEKDPSFEDGNIDISKRTIPFNITGHPALSVSAGNTASLNLPVGLQLIGRYYEEETVYRVADAYQQATGGYRRPPL
ncbi:Asp-tRNA(Asn)/Glu-tRNA(Gln) amidotransferase GatCAB subunit A [Aneurinibacillus tyrosinisolvens]|uniref:Asp-tRNA(Asn)/Glu-tRNA(Gln) amidotransferase GatCAB subunit A n=1 Tax=Aneurinibacillus tyrosinisolvens TaxID=1443435 RepID=UPI00063F7DF3|nr:Asp-tRNA(Asn)/Glu-tRNA(Gln) amidotransferase GatCAB subunit A [Aneurinibacillus tyrosinisolvens]